MTSLMPDLRGSRAVLQAERKSTVAQRGTAVGSPTRPGGRATVRSLIVAVGDVRSRSASLKTVLKPSEVVSAKGWEPAWVAGEPSGW